VTDEAEGVQRVFHTIHDAPGRTLDCTCEVEIERDAETIGLTFPQLRDEDMIGPMVYVCLVGTMLVVRIGSSEIIEREFAYNEKEKRWYPFGRTNPHA